LGAGTGSTSEVDVGDNIIKLYPEKRRGGTS